MLSKDYLERGLVGMARASDAHWVEGHHGGALIAAYYFCKETIYPTRQSTSFENRRTPWSSITGSSSDPSPPVNPRACSPSSPASIPTSLTAAA